MHEIRFTVNGQAEHATVAPTMTLLDLLRDRLALTGTKEGCGIGECGACTVLLDGNPITSCLMLAVEADGHDIETIEGEAVGGELSVLQQAFIDEGATQCGFCTPGMIMSARGLLNFRRRDRRGHCRQPMSMHRIRIHYRCHSACSRSAVATTRHP